MRPLFPDNAGPRYDMPLADKIGQMIIVGFGSPRVSAQSRIIQHIRERNLGGVALFSTNIESYEQVDTLIQQLQSAAATPLLIAIDQEGGYVRRLGRQFGLTLDYTPQQLGAIDDLALTQRYAEENARVLVELGINLNFAPVVDLNTNPYNPIIGGLGRSFSSDPDVVIRHALTFIKAHHQTGVLCTLKHFPGHGSSAQDSHIGFVDVTDSWRAAELEPYARLIAANRCDAVMTAHIYNAALDAELPATLSETILTGILRQRMNYDGIIMTDDIQMAAISSYYDFETAVELAVNAGVDVFASSTYSPAVVERTIATVQMLVESGKIGEERIDDSYRRVMALKERAGRPDASPRQVHTPPVHEPNTRSADNPVRNAPDTNRAPDELADYLF